MEVTVNRRLKDGREYDYLFPKTAMSAALIKSGNAALEDTMQLIPEAIRKTLSQTEKIAKALKGKTQEESCRSLWQFVYDHIKFIRDPEGKEMVQSPAHTWARRAGDCEDMTSFISSCLLNLGIAPVLLRVAMYDMARGYQHIYPVVKLKNGKWIVMDAVLENFNEEYPYLIKKDTKMDLYYLNGLPQSNPSTNIDADDLFGNDLGDLGLRLKMGQGIKKAVTNVKNSKVVTAVKKGVHAVNKINPVTSLLRVGLLAGMKLNIMNVAGRIKYVFLTDQQAMQRKFDMKKFSRLKNVWEKLSKIFHGAGGDIPNLKKAILEGKGNSTKDVPLSGLGYVDNVMYSENMPITRIIGEDMYRAEMNSVQGLNGTPLGVVETAAAVAAATAALTAISELLKSIGNLKAGSGEAQPETPVTTDGSQLPSVDNNTYTAGDADYNLPETFSADSTVAAGDGNAFSTANGGGASAGEESGGAGNGVEEGGSFSDSSDSNVNRTTQNSSTSRTGDTSSGGILDWAKRNKLAAAGIAVGGLAVLIGGTWFIVKKSKEKKSRKEQGISGLGGTRQRKHAPKPKSKGKVRFVKLS